MSAKTIISATTSAVSADAADYRLRVFRVNSGSPMYVGASNLAGSETATIQRKNSDGSWSTILTLTADEPRKEITAPGKYRGGKSATDNACSLDVED